MSVEDTIQGMNNYLKSGLSITLEENLRAYVLSMLSIHIYDYYQF